MKDKIKKVFLLGKVRDINLSDPTKNTQAVQDLKNDIFVYCHAANTNVSINVSNNEIDIFMDLYYQDEDSPGYVGLWTGLLVFGETENYQPPYSFPSMGYFPGLNLLVAIDDFKRIYKKNIKALHASRIKDMDLTVSRFSGINLKLTY